MGLDFIIKVGGEAGQGVQSVGFWLAKAFARGGLFLFADQDYESRIRGGHNFFRIRVRDQPVQAIGEADDQCRRRWCCPGAARLRFGASKRLAGSNAS